MKSLLMFAPNVTDATSFYRAVGPLQSLKKKMGFNLLQGTDVNWAILKGVDAVFLQRPYTPNHVKLIDMAQANGKKIWVDYDDDLFSVPRSNRTFRQYGDKTNQNNVAQIISTADVITVSTAQLKRTFIDMMKTVADGYAKEKRHPSDDGLNLDPTKIHIVPNAYDEEFCFYRDGKKQKKQNKLITWRGSDTHDKDLLTVTNEMKHSLASNLDWTYNFIGSPFWATIEDLETIPGIKETSIVETASVDPVEYWKFLWMTAPALIMTPLWDCPFNRAKSNIAWIEGLHAGAITLAPDWEEWNRPGIVNYKDPKDFGDKLSSFMRGEIDGEKHYEQGWSFLQENLTLNKVNRIRELILRELFEG